MKVIYNARSRDEGEFFVRDTDRGFRYGDGLFETIIYKDHRIQHLGRHLLRLNSGLQILKMHVPGGLTEKNVTEQVLRLLNLNQVRDTARIKLQVWRKEGGLYTPSRQEANYLLTAAPFKEKSGKIIENAAISRDVFLYPTKTSRLKTCNALPYILAGIEKQERKADDLVLLDHRGNIAECTSANIMWIRDGEYFTPSLETGCIEGVMRGYLMDKLQKAGKNVRQVKQTTESLMRADSIFACNVTGIFPVKRLGDKTFDVHLGPELLD